LEITDMQDFTKPFSIDTKPKQVRAEAIEQKVDMAAPNLTKQPQKSFWDSRMNKSNFWNLMFGIGFILGIGLFFILALGSASPLPPYVFIIFWTTLIGIPIIVRHFSKVTFTDGKFLTIEGIELDIPSQLPNGFFIVVTTIGMVILIETILHKFPRMHGNAIANLIVSPIFVISLIFNFVLFFILKNCPISILFNYQFLKQQNARGRSSYYSGPEYKSPFANSYSRSSSSSYSNSSSWISDPTQSYRPGNIHHSSRY